MAQQVQVHLVDDIDGTDADETVSFSIDGISYEIDLNAENAERLREEMATWVGHARKAGRGGGAKKAGRAGRPAARRSATSASGDVRDWGRANGYQVSDRGRVSAELLAAYEAAH